MITGIIESFKKYPDHTAIVHGDRCYSYRQLVYAALGIRNRIINSGNQDTFIGVYTDNNFYTYASILGILFSGKGFIPINHKFPDQRLSAIISEVNVNLFLGCTGFDQRILNFHKNAQFIYSDILPDEPVPGNLETIYIEPSSYAYILFTSGSTGMPKGIPISFHNFRRLLDALNKRIQITHNDKVLQAFELTFDVSLACTFMAWERGAQLVLADLDGIVAVNAFKKIVDEKISVVTLPPSAIFYLKKLKILDSFKCPWIRLTLFTGEALGFSQVESWKTCAMNSEIENAYGPTETTVWCLFHKLNEESGTQAVNGLCPIGVPLDGIDAQLLGTEIVSDAGEETGELIVSGDQIFSGYWKDELKTTAVFWIDQQGRRWYKTGDLVLKNKQGNYVYLNRIDNQVQVNGYRVELGEVEYAIKKLSGYDSVVVLAKQEQNITELYGFIEGEFDKKLMFDGLKESIPFYMMPRDLIRMSSLPLNANGKIDKLQLKETYFK